MKKIFLFGISAFILSCSNTPKCTDIEVTSKVEDAMTKNRNGFDRKQRVKYIFKEYFKEKIAQWEKVNIPEGKIYRYDYEFENDKDFIIISKHFSDYLKHKSNSIPNNLLPLFKIYSDSIYKPKLSNIRLIAEDNTAKICECVGDLTYINDTVKGFMDVDHTITRNYIAQKNSEGEVNVEIYKK